MLDLSRCCVHGKKDPSLFLLFSSSLSDSFFLYVNGFFLFPFCSPNTNTLFFCFVPLIFFFRVIHYNNKITTTAERVNEQTH
ncbi:hypothetical protein STCU_10031 [Strigomonas culicis]|uniref:Uncharacterized protein n=1 Tax=Strigomonas culicis TaxID=28005 RepID=S9UUZ5_9TRYP|nr:hypothetical protein STCU_10031 [Strigomonas culicis]|eukprot:EPY18346.1 hypothetical protein STCU_10031 [Strigomonas culicis]